MRPDCTRPALGRLAAAAILCAAAASFSSYAQAPTDPDWREAEAPPPPALSLDKLIPIDLERTQLQYGVMPSSISIGSDGIVRYVVVAKSDSGAVNAMYEGIRCSSGEYRTYARYNAGTGWSALPGSPWQLMNEARAPRHSLTIARTGACMGHGTVTSVAEIISNLKGPVNRRFNELQ